MAIQDLINEVNSIQTKKQAIKEAITAKGVTSEGKLSKFADEIKQITTSEPDWYIVNKFRYDNGTEALLVRTSDKNAISADKYQMVEIGGGVTKDNNISTSFSSNYDGGFSIINGTYFPRETAYRSFSTFESRNVVFDGHNDNLKLRFRDGKEIVFKDVNTYNWLKGYRNQPLADFNTLYLKSDGISGKAAKTLKDFLASSNETRMSTLGEYGQNPLLLIDSSIMIQAMNLKEMPKTGFIYYSDKTVDPIFLHPVLYYDHYDKESIPFYENKEKYYGNLSPGNYVHLFSSSDFLIVFVSINFVVDSNGQKHKNIEVYIYSIVALGGTKISRITDKPFELYLTFSKQAQQQLQQASSIKIFRKQVLAANGTPEPEPPKPMYLNGLDMLGRFIGIRGTFANNKYINNLFSTKNGSNEVGYVGGDYRDIPWGSIYLAKQLGDAIKANSPIKAFIRLNDNTNNMTFVELEEIPNDRNFTFRIGRDGYYGLSIFQKGINNDNRVIAVFTDESDDDKCKIYRLKKAGTSQYITNDMFSTTETDNQLFITANQPTIEHLNKTPLSKVWTEIQDVLAHKDDFEAYSEL